MNGETNWLDYLIEAFDELVTGFNAYMPTLLAALALLVAGWLIARLIKAIVLRLGASVAGVMQRSGVSRSLTFVRLPWPLSVMAANILFWLVILLFVSTAAEILGLPGAGDWLGAAMSYLPRVFGSLLVVLVGYVVACFMRNLFEVREDVLADARLLGQASFLIINAVAIVAAADQLGIEVSLIQTLIVIAVAAFCGGAAIAFGLGAGGSVDNIIAGYYVRKAYRAGQRVRVGETQGEILEITPTAIILDTGSGRAQVPAKMFNTQVSVLLGGEE